MKYERMLIRLTIVLSAMLWATSAQSAEELVYSHRFVRNVVYCPGDPQYDDWLTYRASFPSAGVVSITVSGSQDEVGRTCSDSVVAQRIADAMRNRTGIFLTTCDGNSWAVGATCQAPNGCGNRDNDLTLTAAGAHCSCSNKYVLRPGIGNRSWGGIKSRSCLPVTQTMTVKVVIEETNQPPDCTLAYAEPDEIWPPNGKLVDVSILGVTDPDGDPVAITISNITQDEPPSPSRGHDQCRDASGIGMSAARPRAVDVGYYAMGFGRGSFTQEPPILAAGETPVLLTDLSADDLASIDVLFVQNSWAFAYGSEYLSRLADIEAAVSDGMILVLHDRNSDTATILPGGAGFTIVRDPYGDSENIDILDNTTLVTNGPGGVLDDSSLDGGGQSSLGYTVAGSLPGDAVLILSRTDPNEIVTMCYQFGDGAVIYSTIPLDSYLAGSVRNANFADIYAPNVVAYGAAGACAFLNEPPHCSLASADVEELWPPNHKFDDVLVAGVTEPDGDPVITTITAIDQDELPLGQGDGNTCPDGDGIGTDVAGVRAERSSPGDGRVYHIGFTAEDGQGGECSGTVTVCVPHDQRGGGECFDLGALYDSTTCGDSSMTADDVP